MKKSIYFLFLFIGIIIITYFSRYVQIDICNDKGLVWDYEQNRCRNDCLKWGHEYGCIQLTHEEITILSKCRIKNKCISNQQFKTICLRNNKTYNLKTNICNFNFDKSQCKDNHPDLAYPLICNEI